METAQQSILNKHSHFHMAVFLTLYVILDTAIKALLLQVSWVLPSLCEYTGLDLTSFTSKWGLLY